MRKMLIAAACALIAAAPALAQPSSQQPRARAGNATEQAESENAGERRICVTERLSGSRMPRRVCRTAREWQALEDGNEERND